MATCLDQFTNANASLPLCEKENASNYNHRLISLLKYLLLSPTGMKTYSPVFFHSHTSGNFHKSIVQKRKKQTCHRDVVARGALALNLPPDFSVCLTISLFSLFLPEGVCFRL